MDRTRAQDHVVGRDVLMVGGDDANRGAAVELDSVDEHVAANDQVASRSRGLEVRIVGGHAAAVAQDQCARAESGGATRVVVVGHLVPETGRRPADGEVERRSLSTLDPDEREGAAAPVQPVATEVDVVLHREEPGQHVVPRPTRAAEVVGPVVVVVGDATEAYQRVDGRRATGTSSPHVQRRGLPVGPHRDEVRPDPSGELHRAEEIPRGHRLGSVGARVIRAGLQQQDARTGIFRQPGRQHRAARSGADHDVVEQVHRAPHDSEGTARSRPWSFVQDRPDGPTLGGDASANRRPA